MKARREELTALLNQASKEYHTDDNATMSDAEYDLLYHELVEIEKSIGAEPNSPTQRVGDGTSNLFTVIPHKVPMLSLDNVFSVEELNAWKTKTGATDFVPQLKLDGLALELVYTDGVLVTASTRGDGFKGEDVTANAMMIANIPKQLPTKGIHVVLGEVVMPRKSLLEYNAWADTPLVNCRNGAAGAMRSSKPETVVVRKLAFYAYEYTVVEGTKNTEGFMARMRSLETYGFETAPYTIDVNDWLTDSHREFRDLLPAEVDGIVFKIDCDALREALGTTSRVPNWAIAYKFPADSATTHVMDIVFQVGRMGTITPVAKVSPVFVGGVTVSSVTLHNVDEMVRLKVEIGSLVNLERAGDVIPKITSVIDPNDTWSLTLPEVCPCCNTKLVLTRHEKQSTTFKCPNRQHCNTQLVGLLEHCVSRKGWNIDGYGEVTLTELVTSGAVRDQFELLTLTSAKLQAYSSVGEKTATKIIARTNAAKMNMEPHRIIYGLAIDEVGESSSKLLYHHFGDIKLLATATYDELISINDIGDVTATNIVNWFKVKENVVLFNNIIAQFTVVEGAPRKHVLNNMTFCLTGSFGDMHRDDVKAEIERLGGKVSGTVSKKTTALIAGTGGGGKGKKAADIGVMVINWPIDIHNDLPELLGVKDE